MDLAYVVDFFSATEDFVEELLACFSFIGFKVPALILVAVLVSVFAALLAFAVDESVAPVAGFLFMGDDGLEGDAVGSDDAGISFFFACAMILERDVDVSDDGDDAGWDVLAGAGGEGGGHPFFVSFSEILSDLAMVAAKGGDGSGGDGSASSAISSVTAAFTSGVSTSISSSSSAVTLSAGSSKSTSSSSSSPSSLSPFPPFFLERRLPFPDFESLSALSFFRYIYTSFKFVSEDISFEIRDMRFEYVR